MKILCVEDDKHLVKLLETTLVSQQHQVEVAMDGRSGWELAESFPYDLILLDLILPEMDGIRFCKKLRANSPSAPGSVNHDTPVLLMTALDTVTNKVMGLDAGADDYVTKPLDLNELMARVRALLRRNQVNRSPLLRWGDLCLSPQRCEVTFRDQVVSLAAKEYEILELFLRNPDQIFSPSRLLTRLWTGEDVPTEGAVRSHIKGLRQKLKQVGLEEIFETHYKLGYRLKPLPVVGGDGNAGDAETRRDEEEGNEAEEGRLSPELWAAWQGCRQNYCDRLAAVRAAVMALKAGALTPAKKHQAEQEVHTLIGSLGSFGLDEASRLSRQLLQLLKPVIPRNTLQIDALLRLVKQVQQQIETYGQASQETKLDEFAPPQKPPLPPALLPLSPKLATLLVVMNDPEGGNSYTTEAIAWGIQAETVASLAQARQKLKQQSPDAILFDLDCADDKAVGLTFLAELQTQYAKIPVLALTTEEALTDRVEAVRLGCQSFLQKPIAPAQVLAEVARVLQRTRRSAGRVLVVDDDPNLLRLLQMLLTSQGYEVTILDHPQRFWQVLEQTTPDLVILDVDLHDYDGSDSSASFSGIDLCQVLRSDPHWHRLPVLFLSAHTDAETVHRGFAARADDFLSKPVVAMDLVTRIRTRLEQRQLWNETDVDQLTGVSLRRKVLKDLTRMLHLARRQRQSLSVAILDLDHFKQVNDQYGHQVGDRVLSYLGHLLLQSFRAEDIVGRWGGEEFVVGMYGMTKHDGMKRLAEVLQGLSQHVFTGENHPPFSVTFSAGIAQFAEDGDDWQTLYQKADEALYGAKAQGRNRIG
jgi:diguanylate cyclase (GGDEF)-like protein